jgi:hypothetical protein
MHGTPCFTEKHGAPIIAVTRILVPMRPHRYFHRSAE